MISALEEIDGAVKCIELGAEDYLQKPFEATLLKARIGACLEKKRLDQEILYLQQVERLTTAAAEIEAKTFNPGSLNDLNQQSDKFDSWFGSSSAWLKKFILANSLSNNR